MGSVQAVGQGELEIVQLLVASKADTAVQDRWLKTPLHDAVITGQVRRTQSLCVCWCAPRCPFTGAARSDLVNEDTVMTNRHDTPS